MKLTWHLAKSQTLIKPVENEGFAGVRLPHAGPFLPGGHLFFFWPDGRTIRGEGAFVFFLRLRFVFLGLFFFRTDGRTISWLGPGRQTNNQNHVT